MQGDFVVNIPKLREQSQRFLQEKNIADHLLLTLKKINKLSQPEKVAVYRKLIRQVDEVSKFYGDMSNVADSTANDIVNVMSSVMVELEENALHNARRFNLND